jgi:hypothetical protein
VNNAKLGTTILNDANYQFFTVLRKKVGTLGLACNEIVKRTMFRERKHHSWASQPYWQPNNSKSKELFSVIQGRGFATWSQEVINPKGVNTLKNIFII